MTTLEPLLSPSRIAVVGGSADPTKAGYGLMKALASFPGDVVVVNPARDEVLGHPCYPSISDVPGPVDLAILAVPAEVAVDIVGACGSAGVRAAILCAGGFSETGADGAARQQRLAKVIRDTGVRVLGPNTSGLINPPIGLAATFVPSAARIPAGQLSIVAQSGGVQHALAFLAAGRGLGVHIGVGLGNAVDIGFVEILDHLASTITEGVVALHVEGFQDGRAVVPALQRLTQRVPVVALAIGRSDVSELARSHTGAMTVDRDLAHAALERGGAVVVDDLDELLDAATALAATRLPPTRDAGVGIVSGQAGPALIITDLLRSRGVRVPELAPHTVERINALLPPGTFTANPVDTGRPGPTFPAVVGAVTEDPSIDVVLAYALHEPGAVGLEDLAEVTADVPLLVATGGLSRDLAPTAEHLWTAGVPMLRSPEAGARAVRALVADARAASRRAPLPIIGDVPQLALAGQLDEFDLKAMLRAAGIRVPDHHRCATRDEAQLARSSLNGPVVAKILTPCIAHKGRAGGVVLGIRTAAELDAALDRLDSAGATSYLIEAQADDAVELIVGGTNHPAYGPTVLVGLGGTATEAIDDTVTALGPVTVTEVLDLLGRLRGQAQLDGRAGLPPIDRTAAADAVARISTLVAASPWLHTFEVNPLRSGPSGTIALDAWAVAPHDHTAGSTEVPRWTA